MRWACAFLAVAMAGMPAWAWGPLTHQAMARRTLEERSIRPYVALFGLDVERVVLAATEPIPQETFQWGAWGHIRNDGKEHNRFLEVPAFAALNFVRFLGCVLHNSADCGVPMGHSPAREVYINTLLEGIFEAEFASGLPVPPWSKVPLYTGPYSRKIQTFYADQIELAKWVKSHHGPRELPLGLARGVRNGLRLGQAVTLDVFLQLDPGDTNWDGRVDRRDVWTVVRHFGTRSGMTVDRGDLNGDGAVDQRDLEIVIQNYGRPPVGGTVKEKNPPIPRPRSWPTPGAGAIKFLEEHVLSPLRLLGNVGLGGPVRGLSCLLPD